MSIKLGDFDKYDWELDQDDNKVETLVISRRMADHFIEGLTRWRDAGYAVDPDTSSSREAFTFLLGGPSGVKTPDGTIYPPAGNK